jgi:hypothetical protein
LTYDFFKALAALKLLRVSREVELQGLDLPEMGALGYPTDWEPSDLEEARLKPIPGQTAPAYGTAD